MWVLTKDELTEPKCDKGGMANNNGSLWESPNPMGQLYVPFPLTPFFNTASSSAKAQCRLGPCHHGWVVAIDWQHPLGSQWSRYRREKNIWVALHHRRTKWWRSKKSRQVDKHWEETMAFNMPARWSVVIKLTLDNFVSTHSFQHNDVPNSNLKKMGMGNEVPWWMSRLGMEEAKGVQETSKSWQQRESHTRHGRVGE